MTLRRMVADMVILRGGASADDLAPELIPNGFNREQIIRALHNAKNCGWLTCEGRSARKGKPRGTPHTAMYYPAASAMAKMMESLRAKEKPQPCLVSSVFELGNPKPETAWPKPPAVRNVYHPLGPWRTEEEVTV